MSQKQLRVAFIHPDLGIGGAERLVVDAALGLQKLGHSVGIYTSHHDPTHCFEETIDGRLQVHHVRPPFPRSFKGKFHIIFAHLRQLHLICNIILSRTANQYDVFFVDQLSTCIPFIRCIAGKRVVFYCHFPDKLLANGAFVEGGKVVKKQSLAKQLYRLPMDWLEELTTRQADIILSNSKFTARVFKTYFPSIPRNPSVVYPGINLDAYEGTYDPSDADVASVVSDRPTLISLNRFEGKKNIILALESFARLKKSSESRLQNLRLVLAGGYDDRLEDNKQVIAKLQDLSKALSLQFAICSPAPLPDNLTSPSLSTVPDPDIIFLLNFTTSQRTALLYSQSTLALLYTPENEHFGIVPIEAMACGVPVLACNSGGPLESVLQYPAGQESGTGWLCPPDPDLWAEALIEIVSLSIEQREGLSAAAKKRAKTLFGMEAMAKGLGNALQQAVSMGSVEADEVWGRWWKAWVMIVGFLLAYYYSSSQR
ncbi:alpha-1,3-mannosyltransferase ALG2 [Coprinopsis marcescibilis]|uniref:Alpha-1,3/1,6-mannosyltransferase ALG2 n=1 Tax=Coprinopsis marcescibilis TaxID=230819 RepID=A0A5C3L3C2_COPMA|nr:alpha-1,3-mannosyltransferase ALG2 [Coprinopsis marcescibilis]